MAIRREEHPYKVQPGDTLPSIAKESGFGGNWQKIYFYEKNNEFRESNKNPNVLHPNKSEEDPSIIIIPPINEKNDIANTDQQHRYQAPGSERELRLKMVNLEDKLLCDYYYSLDLDDVTYRGKIEKDGMIKKPYFGAKKAKLTLWLDPSKPYEGASLQWTIRIDQNPVDILSRSESGARARLNNLGFWAGTEEKKETPDPFGEAIKSFQKKYMKGVDPKGTLDEATCMKIKEIYGC